MCLAWSMANSKPVNEPYISEDSIQIHIHITIWPAEIPNPVPWMGLRASLDIMEKRESLAPTRDQTPTHQSSSPGMSNASITIDRSIPGQFLVDLIGL
jgi:hypothetical protein